jgi:hypothetical protein
VIRPSVVLLATLMASPSLYLAFVTEQLPVQDALGRYLLAIAAAAVMMAGLRFITASYGTRQEQRIPLRRRTDHTDDGA